MFGLPFLAFLLPVGGFFKAIDAFFATPLGQKIAIVLAVLACVAGVWFGGVHHGRSVEKVAQARLIAAAEVKARKAEDEAAAMTAKIRSQTEAVKVEIRYRTRTLTKEIPVYVTPEADARCVVPVGFVSLYNQAVAGGAEVPERPGGPLDAPSGVDLSEVLATDVPNLGVANEALAEARAWRSWYPQAKAIYDKATAR